MNILVVGYGWAGKKVLCELQERDHTVIISSHKNVFDILDQYQYDWVINCAGVTGTPNVDACELNKKGTLEGNAVFPILLYHKCQNVGSRFAHFSSGCIYSGDITDPNADPNFFGSIYSVSKGVSDTYLKDKAQVYRIRMPFTPVNEPKNYLSKVLKYAKTGKLIDYGQNSLTDLNEAVRVACDLIEMDAPNNPYNLVNSGSINMHELTEILGISPAWYTPEEFQAVTTAARSTCTIPAYKAMRPVREALIDAISILNNN
jgi:dTDP-4-dehydrorhamnose reductase